MSATGTCERALPWASDSGLKWERHESYRENQSKKSKPGDSCPGVVLVWCTVAHERSNGNDGQLLSDLVDLRESGGGHE